MSEIITPDTNEWLIDGRPTPAFIQYIEQFKTWINERQVALDAEAALEDEDNLRVAEIAASDLEQTTSTWFDTDGADYSTWIFMRNKFVSGSATNVSDEQNFRKIWATEAPKVYYQQQDILDRLAAVEAALVAAGLMEIA